METTSEANNEFGSEIKQTDLTLLVEDHKVPVSKSVLCIASPVFRTMLEGDFQEKSKTEITLPGKNYEDFVEFLRCIYPDRLKKVTVKNAYQLLPLAHEYQVQKILHRCEKVICQIVRKKHTKDVMELYRHIQISETFSLQDLHEACMYIVSELTLEEFEKGREKYNISDDSHLKIIKYALRRRELNSEDEKDIAVCISDSSSSRFSSRPMVTATLTLHIKEDHFDTEGSLRALRLAKRFRINNDVQMNIIKKMKHPKDISDRLKEQFKLLPEEIKQKMAQNK